jgi:hypothetical protein
MDAMRMVGSPRTASCMSCIRTSRPSSAYRPRPPGPGTRGRDPGRHGVRASARPQLTNLLTNLPHRERSE